MRNMDGELRTGSAYDDAIIQRFKQAMFELRMPHIRMNKQLNETLGKYDRITPETPIENIPYHSIGGLYKPRKPLEEDRDFHMRRLPDACRVDAEFQDFDSSAIPITALQKLIDIAESRGEGTVNLTVDAEIYCWGSDDYGIDQYYAFLGDPAEYVYDTEYFDVIKYEQALQDYHVKVQEFTLAAIEKRDQDIEAAKQELSLLKTVFSDSGN